MSDPNSMAAHPLAEKDQLVEPCTPNSMSIHTDWLGRVSHLSAHEPLGPTHYYRWIRRS